MFKTSCKSKTKEYQNFKFPGILKSIFTALLSFALKLILRSGSSCVYTTNLSILFY